MSRTITKIPATIIQQSGKKRSIAKKRKVAGYARVSTDHDEQTSSYETQVTYYRKFIESHEDWEFVEIYSDEGISGTETSRRIGFNRMLSDALAGKIDLIITKSVSRFARNTVDSLTAIRKLKDKGVEVFFEKENIWTFDSKGELLLTIMSSLAQEESRSISENVTWGIRKGFSQGKYSLPFASFLGYERGPDGSIVVNKEQAKLVKRIYGLYLSGMSTNKIAQKFTEEGIPTPTGKNVVWRSDTIMSILRNEKYKGDALLQKSYTKNYIGGVMAKNNGEVPQYYIEHDHEAIIDPLTFDEVQAEILRRKGTTATQTGDIFFSGRVRCAQCGSIFGPKIWHSNDKYRRVVWMCNDKYGKTHKRCTSGHISEETMKAVVTKALNKLLSNKDDILAAYDEVRTVAFDTTLLEAELEDHNTKMLGYSEQMNKANTLNASRPLDQDEFSKEYEKLTKKYKAEKTRIQELEAAIKDKKVRRAKADAFIKHLTEADGSVDTFSPFLWTSLCDGLAVYSQTDIRVLLKNGDEITA